MADEQQYNNVCACIYIYVYNKGFMIEQMEHNTPTGLLNTLNHRQVNSTLLLLLYTPILRTAAADPS